MQRNTVREPRVLILSVSAGAGHVMAAKAVEQAFAITGGASAVLHEDVMDWSNSVFRKLYADSYLKLVNHAPNLLGMLYNWLDEPWQKRRSAAFERMNTSWLWRLIDHFRPDVIVCTHFLPSELISWKRQQGLLSIPQVIAVTDLDCHALWMTSEYEQYFVHLDSTKQYMGTFGIDPSRITVSGIPINPAFAQVKDKREMRAKHGLKLDRTSILLSAGGFGVGPVDELLGQLLSLKHEAEIVVICGRNQALKSKIEQRAAALAPAHISVKAMGFTDKMDELMAAADLIVGKPGGLTTSEALARGLGFVIVNPIPGQEERNSAVLLERGAAVRCNDIEILAFKIDELLDAPLKLASLQANARALARPRSALDLVEKVKKLTTGSKLVSAA